MLNYTEAFYKMIGKRIKKTRKENNLTQEDLEEKDVITVSVLSRAENGNAQPKRNPYLLNVSHIKSLCNAFKISCSELIWGNEKDQENFVKFLLLAILLNGNSMNPFLYFDSKLELYKWLYTQAGIPEELACYLYCAIDVYEQEPNCSDSAKLIPLDYPEISLGEINTKVKTYLEQSYTFFYDETGEYYNAYESLLKEDADKSICPAFDKELLALSDIIFKDLMHDYNFTVDFTNHATPSVFTENEISAEIEQLIIHPSSFINNALDYKGYSYSKFVNAFNRLWEKRKDTLMPFFQKHLFHNKELENSGLKHFKSRDFDRIIKSDEFYQLCNTANIMEEYTDPETILAKNYFRSFIQSRLQQNAFSRNKIEDLAFWDYVADSMLKTKECAESILNNK